ncbi:MAG: hypothetical protein Q7T82_17115 [Armatimonadota bacterium]|nr:hypothetical protein [Armatimonadota bacterium]
MATLSPRTEASGAAIVKAFSENEPDRKRMKHSSDDGSLPTAVCSEIDRMIARSTGKLIAPVLTAGVLRRYIDCGTDEFSEAEMREVYEKEVCSVVRDVLRHNLHIGGDYEDAYSSRTLPKYGVVIPVGHRRYKLSAEYAACSSQALGHILQRIPAFATGKLGGVIALGSREARVAIAGDPCRFVDILDTEAGRSAAHFEIVSFAVLRMHLEKFACKVYRTLRTSAHDSGVDIATDYGAVYQIKKMRLRTREDVEAIYSEILTNFDEGRLRDQKVVLIIDELSSGCRQFLVDMRVQPLVREDILALARLLTDDEDRQKVLRVVHDEFEREYRSDVCMSCRTRPRIEACQFIPLAAAKSVVG